MKQQIKCRKISNKLGTIFVDTATDTPISLTNYDDDIVGYFPLTAPVDDLRARFSQFDLVFLEKEKASPPVLKYDESIDREAASILAKHKTSPASSSNDASKKLDAYIAKLEFALSFATSKKRRELEFKIAVAKEIKQEVCGE